MVLLGLCGGALYYFTQSVPAEQLSSVTDRQMDNVQRSIDLLRDSGIDYRFRTTLIPGVHDDAVREELSARFAGDPLVFQQFRHTSGILSDYPPER